MENKNDYVPKNYEDLWRYYVVGDGRGNSLTHQLIRRFMRYADQDEQESLASDVFLKLFEAKMLERFDPTKSNFGGVIFFTTRTVCTAHLAKKSRNPITGLCGGTIRDGEAESFEPGVYYLDRLFPAQNASPDEAIDLRELFEALWEKCQRLAEKPKANTRERSLLPLLELLAKEADPHECSAKLGVTTSTISNWTTALREMAEDIKAFVLQPRKTKTQGRMMPAEE